MCVLLSQESQQWREKQRRKQKAQVVVSYITKQVGEKEKRQREQLCKLVI